MNEWCYGLDQHMLAVVCKNECANDSSVVDADYTYRHVDYLSMIMMVN